MSAPLALRCPLCLQDFLADYIASPFDAEAVIAVPGKHDCKPTYTPSF